MVVLPLSAQIIYQSFLQVSVLAGAKLHLFQNDLVPNEASIVADFTEATFSGYASVAIVAWGEPFIGPGNRVEADAPSVQFNHDGGAVANDVYGWYLLHGTTGDLLAAERFVNGPYTLESTFNSLVTLPRFAVDPPADLDSFAQ